jgi:hypothetical protein
MTDLLGVFLLGVFLVLDDLTVFWVEAFFLLDVVVRDDALGEVVRAIESQTMN